MLCFDNFGVFLRRLDKATFQQSITSFYLKLENNDNSTRFVA